MKDLRSEIYQIIKYLKTKQNLIIKMQKQTQNENFL